MTGQSQPYPQTLWVRPHDLWLKILASLGVLGLTTLVAVGGLPQWEVDLFDFLNSGPAWLPGVLWAPMQFGSLFGPVLVALVAWLRWRTWRPWVGSIVAPVIAWQLAKVVKWTIERGRPFEEIQDLTFKSGTPQEGLGFVSGHSAIAFALAAVLSPYLTRPMRVAAYAVAVLVGLARIDVGAHLPLDIVGGGALGYAIALCWHLGVGQPSVPLEVLRRIGTSGA